MRIRALLAASFLLAVVAPPVAASPAISLNGPAQYQQSVTFTVTGLANKYDCVGNGKCARVEVRCSQVDTLVYAETGDLGQARGDGTSPLGYSGFLLGGGYSQWVANGGGPADCIANLFRFDNSGPTQQFVVLASTTFTAAG